MSTLDDLVLNIRMNDEAKGQRQQLLRELRQVQKELENVRKEQGADSAAARELEQRWNSLDRQATEYTKQLEKTAAASRKARRELADQDKKVDALRQSWSRLGNVLTGVTIAGMVYGVNRLIKTYAEADAMQSQLQVSMLKFPAAANVSRQSYLDLNNAIMLATGADDDMLAKSEAVLARFGIEGDAIQKLMPLVNDLAIAKGVDVVTASQAVGKALLGNSKGLKDVGIAYKATGNRANDVRDILALLEQQVGGTGAAFGQTAQGDLAKFDQITGNIKESLGEGLSPILKPVNSGLATLMGTIGGMPAGMRAGASAAVLVTGAFISMLPQITQATVLLKLHRTQQQLTGAESVSLKSRLGGVAGFLAGPWGIALMAGAGALTYLAGQAAESEQRVKQFQDQIDATTGKLNQAGIKGAMDQLQTDINAGDWKILDKFGVGLNEATKAAIAGGPELKAYTDKVRAAYSSMGGSDFWSNERKVLIAAEGNVKALGDEIGTSQQNWAASGVVARELGIDIDGMGGAAGDAAAEINPLTAAVNGFGDALRNKQAVRDWDKSVRDFGKKHSMSNAEASMEAFQSAYSSFKEGSREQIAFVQSNYGQMRSIIDQSGLKDSTKAALLAPLDEVKRKADEANTALDQLSGKNVVASITLQQSKGYGITLPPTTTYSTGKTDDRVPKAMGGRVFGAGSATSDSIPAWLSNREYVVRANAADTLGDGVLAGINAWDRLSPAQRAPIIAKMSASIPTLPAYSGPSRTAPAQVRHGDRIIHVTAAQGVDVRAELAAWERMNAAEQAARAELVP